MANEIVPRPPEGQLLIYQDGGLQVQVRIDGQTVWLTQAGMAELFQTTSQNITMHLKSIYEEGEQDEAATCKEFLQVRQEGMRQVQRSLKHYNLDATRPVLNRLVEIGLVEPRGERKGRTWHLSAATYRRLGKPAAYIRQRGFEPLQQEQMVLQYVGKHGSISRRELADLCRLATGQAYRLLKRLETAGKVVRIGGSTKGVRYGLPSK
ncbi:MAG TPA: winged helix-turn-helix transcriptional regulator [Phycisphaerales bacterium]|nr:winged helix-turn-helix transcriptional regulator [Phycisphaerales bacterium]